MRPLAIDLFCGLGGWTEGLLAEGYSVVGFDIEQHVYSEDRYPAQLVVQDVLTLHGGQFRDAALIVASPPCQEFSYMAMPWKRAKQIAAALRGEGEFPAGYKGSRTVADLTALFDACFRIQREACDAAGRHVPLVVENVKGAQPWVGRSAWNFGSFHLWGDVPALMPTTLRGVKLGGGRSWYPPDDPRHQPGLDFTRLAGKATKNDGGSWFAIGSPGQKVVGRNPDGRPIPGNNPARGRAIGEGAKGSGSWFGTYAERKARWAGNQSLTSSKSKARKRASALIAKIPLPLSQYIARTYYPSCETVGMTGIRLMPDVYRMENQ